MEVIFLLSDFNIKKAPSEFIIPKDSFESFFDLQEINQYAKVAAEEQSQEKTPNLFILPSAFEELNEHISWKTRTPQNLSEQGGILVGCVYKDKITDLICGVVRHIIPSVKSGNAAYIQFTHDDWISMYKIFEDKYASCNDNNNLQKVIGWYHTHPNMPVRMSDIDKQTHINFFQDIYQFSVIFNPQLGIWSVFNGTECKNCNGLLFCPKSIEALNENETNTSSQLNEGTKIDSECIYKNINSESTNSFVIKRYASDAQNIVQVNHQGTDNRINQYQLLLTDNSIKCRIRMKQRYKGKILQNKDTCYYYPINDNHNYSHKSYLICDSLVRRFASLIDYWEFDSRQSVALIYYLYERKNFYNVSPVKYVTFDLKDGLAVDGFVFSANANELIEYIGPSFKKNDVAVTVVYSAHNPTYQSLCEMYGNCDCVLWINPCNTNEFEFYVFDAYAKEMKKNFNIRSRSSFAMEQHLHKQSIQSEKELESNWIGGFSLSYNDHIISSKKYLKAKNDVVLQNEFMLNISKDFLVLFLEKIRRYEKITGSFTIIISYISHEKSPTNSILKINPSLDEILRICFFTQNNCNCVYQSVCLKDLNKYDNDTYTKQKKVAFIISNRDVNIDSFKNKLFGHSSAVCFNIETQNCCFYQLR